MKKFRGSLLLDNPELWRKQVFSFQEASRMLSCPGQALHAILYRLVRKGKLLRIKRGLFAFNVRGNGPSQTGYPQNWYVVGRALAEKAPYFFSYYTAMHLHGMTTESVQTLFMSLAKQRRLSANLKIPLYWVAVRPETFWGLEELWVTHEEKVWASNLERTIIDILDRPDLSGGILEIARGLELVKRKIDYRKLAAYARRFGSFAAAKRLGFLCEILSLGSEQAPKSLQKFVKRSASYALFDPTLAVKGSYLSRWHLRVNLEPDEIKRNLMT